MLISVRAQKPLPLGGITGDAVQIWDTDLKGIDHLLADDKFIDVLWQSFHRTHPKAHKTGRHRMALNRSLRTAALKHIKQWSFPALGFSSPYRLSVQPKSVSAGRRAFAATAAARPIDKTAGRSVCAGAGGRTQRWVSRPAAAPVGGSFLDRPVLR
jgi:hypothetical protein